MEWVKKETKTEIQAIPPEKKHKGTGPLEYDEQEWKALLCLVWWKH